MTAPLLRMSGVDKHFPGVQALTGAGLEVLPGEVPRLVDALVEAAASLVGRRAFPSARSIASAMGWRRKMRYDLPTFSGANPGSGAWPLCRVDRQPG